MRCRPADDDDEELAPRSPLAFSSGVASGSVCDIADVPHDEEVPAEPCGVLSAAADALGGDDDWVHVGRGGRPGREPSSLLRKEGLERSLAFKRWARGRCFRCLERDHQVSICREPFRCIRCRRLGHRERFCHARFPAARSPNACARSPDARAPCQRSRSPSAQPRHPSASRSWVEVVCRSSSTATSPPRPSPRCCEEFNVDASVESRLQCQFALLRLELVQLVSNHVEDVSRPLREEVASLKLLLARVGVPLEQIEACSSGGKDLATVQASFPLGSVEQKSSVVEDEHLYSCSSPRGSPVRSLQPIVSAVSESEHLDRILAPVQITPELHELCGDSSVVFPSALGLDGASPPSQSLGFEKSGVVGAAVSLSPESCRHMVPFGDGVAKSRLLAKVPGAVVAREVCDFLATLAAAYPGSAVD